MPESGFEKAYSNFYDGRISPNKLVVGQSTSTPAESRFKGLPVGRDGNGFYMYGQVKTGSYPSVDEIPQHEVNKVLKSVGIKVEEGSEQPSHTRTKNDDGSPKELTEAEKQAAKEATHERRREKVAEGKKRKPKK